MDRNRGKKPAGKKLAGKKGKFTGPKHCKNCGKFGHLAADCWFNKSRGGEACDFCDMRDHHSSENCFFNPKNKSPVAKRKLKRRIRNTQVEKKNISERKLSKKKPPLRKRLRDDEKSKPVENSTTNEKNIKIKEDKNINEIVAEQIIEQEKRKQSVESDKHSKEVEEKKESVKRKSSEKEGRFADDKERKPKRPRNNSKLAHRLGPKPQWKRRKNYDKFEKEEFENLSVTLYRRDYESPVRRSQSRSPRLGWISRGRSLSPRNERQSFSPRRYHRESSPTYRRESDFSPAYRRDSNDSPSRYRRESSLSPRRYEQSGYSPLRASRRDYRSRSPNEYYGENFDQSEDLMLPQRSVQIEDQYPQDQCTYATPLDYNHDMPVNMNIPPPPASEPVFYPETRQSFVDNSMIQPEAHMPATDLYSQSYPVPPPPQWIPGDQYQMQTDYYSQPSPTVPPPPPSPQVNVEKPERTLRTITVTPTEVPQTEDKQKKTELPESLTAEKRKEFEIKRSQFCDKLETLYSELRRLEDQKDNKNDEVLSKEKDKLLKEVNRQVKLIQNLIIKMNKLLGLDEEDFPKPIRKESQEVSKKQPTETPKEDREKSPDKSQVKKEKAEKGAESSVEKSGKEMETIYVCYDSSNHWCRPCDKFPQSVQEYLEHLQSSEHASKMPKNLEVPWKKLYWEKQQRGKKGKIIKRPVQGLQWFVPVYGWYCRLCDETVPEYKMALLHLESKKHIEHYEEYIAEYPDFEPNWNIERQKAYKKYKTELEKLKIEIEKMKEEKKRSEENVKMKFHSSQDTEETVTKKHPVVVDLVEKEEVIELKHSVKSKTREEAPGSPENSEEDKEDEELFQNQSKSVSEIDRNAISHLKVKLQEKRYREEIFRKNAMQKSRQRQRRFFESKTEELPKTHAVKIVAPAPSVIGKMPSFKLHKNKTDSSTKEVEKPTTSEPIRKKEDLINIPLPDIPEVKFTPLPKVSARRKPTMDQDYDLSLLGISPDDSAFVKQVRVPPKPRPGY